MAVVVMWWWRNWIGIGRGPHTVIQSKAFRIMPPPPSPPLLVSLILTFLIGKRFFNWITFTPCVFYGCLYTTPNPQLNYKTRIHSILFSCPSSHSATPTYHLLLIHPIRRIIPRGKKSKENGNKSSLVNMRNFLKFVLLFQEGLIISPSPFWLHHIRWDHHATTTFSLLLLTIKRRRYYRKTNDMHKKYWIV